MTVLITVPLTIYLGFLGRCRLASREYAILRNAIVEHSPDPANGKIVVEFLCSLEDAEMLFDHASRFYPLAAPYIEDGIHLAKQGGGGGVAQSGLDWDCRRSASEQTWHICSNCAQWPTDNFVSTNQLPWSAEICNECRVKKEHGDCSRAKYSGDTGS